MRSPTNERRDIDGKGRTIWELFNNRRYDIDSFQREYKWQKKQLVELVADLIGQFLENYATEQELTAVAKYGHYFLGSIILSQKEGKSFVIDGQQRLTTLSQYADSIRERKKGAKPGDFDRLGTEFHRWVREPDNLKRLGLHKSADYVRFVERDFRFYTDQYETFQLASIDCLKGLELVYAISWLGFTHQYPRLLAPLKPSDDDETRMRKIQLVATFVDILLARRLWNSRSIAYSTMQYAMFLVMRGRLSEPWHRAGLPRQRWRPCKKPSPAKRRRRCSYPTFGVSAP